MIEYCKQDTYVTYRLYAHFLKKKPDVRMLTLEHKFAKLMRVQEWNGFPFDVKAAEKLTSDLMVRRAELGDDLAKSFGPSPMRLRRGLIAPRRYPLTLTPVTKYVSG
jgi:DNA polymerase I-like protein with 3'-5' exonuclease and polymerase domains